MMAGNPNWWSMNDMQSHQLSSSQLLNYVSTNNSTLISSNPSPSTDHHRHSNGQDLPVRSWSQLLLGGEEERFGASIFQQQKKLENWEDQVLLNLNPISNFTRVNNNPPNVKQESNISQYCSSQVYGHLDDDDDDDDQFQGNNNRSSNSCTNYWPNSCHQVMPVSSPTSCITTLSNNNNNNFLNFSGGKSATTEQRKNHRHNQDHSSECNSTGTGGASKKARVTQSSAQPALKVRKEKLGDRITALHQLVSPFGKTDTASVLSESIGYIRFLQGQIEALSSPYMRNSGSTGHHQHSVQERNCLFPEEGGQFLNDIGMEGRGASKQDLQGRSGVKDLRSRGLCLVPISCTQHVGNDNAADYWAPAALGGGF